MCLKQILSVILKNWLSDNKITTRVTYFYITRHLVPLDPHIEEDFLYTIILWDAQCVFEVNACLFFAFEEFFNLHTKLSGLKWKKRRVNFSALGS